MRLTQNEFSDVVAAMESPVQAPACLSAASVPAVERRQSVRVAVSFGVKLWIVQGGKLSALLASARNISLVGMEVVSAVPLTPGQELIVGLPRLTGAPLYWCAVVSRSAGQGRAHCGLEFSGPAPQQAVDAIQSRPTVAKEGAAA
jgi:ABC-type glucose/galactose transport system permease subunit